MRSTEENHVIFSTVVDFVAVKAPKSHKDQQGLAVARYTIQ
jgi:hypothetical protein